MAVVAVVVVAVVAVVVAVVLVVLVELVYFFFAYFPEKYLQPLFIFIERHWQTLLTVGPTSKL